MRSALLGKILAKYGSPAAGVGDGAGAIRRAMVHAGLLQCVRLTGRRVLNGKAGGLQNRRRQPARALRLSNRRDFRSRPDADRHRGQIAADRQGDRRGELRRRRSQRAKFILFNANIPEYLQANRFNHEPKRPRKLLLKSQEIAKLAKGIEREGMTIVPLRIYFNEKGRAKIDIALARGKKLHDKRETEKARDWNREKGACSGEGVMGCGPSSRGASNEAIQLFSSIMAVSRCSRVEAQGHEKPRRLHHGEQAQRHHLYWGHVEFCRGGRGNTMRRWFLASRRATAASCWYGLNSTIHAGRYHAGETNQGWIAQEKADADRSKNPSWRDLYEDLASAAFGVVAAAPAPSF